MNALRLLITRPEPDAARTAAALHARGHDVLVAPLLRMEPVKHPKLGAKDWAGLLVTSANAIRALSIDERHALCALPLLAVGDHTAEAARAAGFRDVRSAAGDANDLVALAAAAFGDDAAPALYLAGEERAHDLSAALARHKVAVHTTAIYRMARAERLPASIREALTAQRLEGALHYSPRTATTYLACAEVDGLVNAACAPIHYCLSEEIGARLAAAGAANVKVAAAPNEMALLRLIDAP